MKLKRKQSPRRTAHSSLGFKVLYFMVKAQGFGIGLRYWDSYTVRSWLEIVKPNTDKTKTASKLF